MDTWMTYSIYDKVINTKNINFPEYVNNIHKILKFTYEVENNTQLFII